jgi:hypothetical protein
MNQPVPDRTILDCIYSMYGQAFIRRKDGHSPDDKIPYFSISIRDVASKLQMSPDMLFGQLYYHLDFKHRYRQDDGSLVHLFALKVGGTTHAINMPYVASILAEQNQEQRKQSWSLGLSIVALGISLTSLLVNVLKHTN